MSPLTILAAVVRLAQPLAVEASLSLEPPETLWLQPGAAFAWPAPPNADTMAQALWRNQEGQVNILAGAAGESIPLDTQEGASLAAQDFKPVFLQDGRTWLASAAYLVRSQIGPGRPEPSFIASSKLGLRSEIRMLMDPTAYRLGSDAFVKLYVDGNASPGDFTVLPPDGVVRSLKTGGGNVGVFQLDQPGVWAVRFQRETASTVWSSTLWFEARAWEEGK